MVDGVKCRTKIQQNKCRLVLWRLVKPAWKTSITLLVCRESHNWFATTFPRTSGSSVGFLKRSLITATLKGCGTFRDEIIMSKRKVLIRGSIHFLSNCSFKQQHFFVYCIYILKKTSNHKVISMTCVWTLAETWGLWKLFFQNVQEQKWSNYAHLNGNYADMTRDNFGC